MLLTEPIRRKVFPCLLAVVLVLMVAPADAVQNPFTDVGGSTTVEYSASNTLLNLGITSGCSGNPSQFCPDPSLMRDQMAVFIVRSWSIKMYGTPSAFMTLAPPYTGHAYFQDVQSTDPFFNFVQ